ncbi:hypothetical protein D3C80_1841610 [compost metagenome]
MLTVIEPGHVRELRVALILRIEFESVVAELHRRPAFDLAQAVISLDVRGRQVVVAQWTLPVFQQ